MAVLNNIRKRGIFLIIVIAMALFSFILADVIQQGGFSSDNSQNIATINGKDISYSEFSSRLQVAQQNFPDNVSTVQAVNQVWENTLQQTLLEEQISKLGIDAGSKQIVSALAQQFGQNPNFATNGEFDINKFRGYIQQLKAVSPEAYQQWVMQENDIAEQSKANVYFNLLGSGLGITSSDARELHKLNNQKFEIQYVRVPFSAVKDEEINVSNADIQQYIDEHKKEFETKGSRDIRYVFFEEKATPEDEEAIKEELVRLLDDHKTYNRAADIEETVKGFKNTTNFQEYLSENSDIGYQDNLRFKSDLPKEYADTLFTLDKGEGFGPYKEDGYWKYSQVVDIKQTPDSVKVSHILISYSGAQIGLDIDRTPAEAEKLADSVLTMAKDGKTNFYDLASDYTDDINTMENGGDLGWIGFPRGQANPFTNFIFGNDEGTIGMVETEYGYHIIKIEEARNKQKAIKLATLAKLIEASESTTNDLFNKTTKFQIAAKEGDFAEEAKKESYNVRTVKGLQPMDEHISGLGRNRSIVQWAFEEKLQPGEVTRFDLNGGYAVVQLTGKSPEGVQTPEEAAARVRPILVQKKKAALLKENITTTNLDKIAEDYSSKVNTEKEVTFSRPFLGSMEPQVVAKAFSMKEGEVSEPITGGTGVFVIKLLKKQDLDNPESYDEVIAQENQRNMQFAAQQLLQALKDKATIQDNRETFY